MVSYCFCDLCLALAVPPAVGTLEIMARTQYSSRVEVGQRSEYRATTREEIEVRRRKRHTVAQQNFPQATLADSE